MTNQTQEKDPLNLWRETEVILRCLNKPDANSPDPIMEKLEEAKKLMSQPLPANSTKDTRQRGEAYRLLAEVLDTLNRYDNSGRREDVLKGITYIYCGVFHHQQNDWMRAADEYQHAWAVFKAIPDRHNAAVAVFARGLLYARQDRLDQVPEVTGALEVLWTSECRRSAEEIWQLARKAAKGQTEKAETREPTPESSKQTESQKVESIGVTDEASASAPRPATPPAQPNESFLVLLGILAFIIAVIGGRVVFLWGGKRGLGVYVIAFPLAVLGYLLVFFFRKACEIPAGHVALIDSFGQSRLREGPYSFRCLPIFQQIKAIVPIYPLTYISQKQKMPAKGGGSVEINLTVRYQVGYEAHRDEPPIALDHVRRAIDCIQDAALKTPGSSVKKEGPWTHETLRPLWHRKLATEINSTLYQTLPDQLALDKLDDGRKQIREQIQGQLQARTAQWGIYIERVDIAELSEAKE